MADLSDSNKIKQLFSSFLSNSAGNSSKEGNGKDSNGQNESNNSSGQKTSTIDEGSAKPASVETVPLETNEFLKRPSDSRSRIEFFQRVATYSPVTWCAKPLSLSPLECARYGWENVDMDMLQCSHCRVFLCGQLPKTVGEQSYKESCQQLKKNLVESHEKLCKWSSFPSPESFIHVQYRNRKELCSDFCKRVISLAGVEGRLPEVTYSSHSVRPEETEEVTREGLAVIVSQIIDFLRGLEIACSETIIIYSMSGWDYNESHKDVIQCNYCCHKVCLWNNNSSRSSTPDMEGDEPAKKERKLEKTSFNPIAGHRYWCPWLQIQTPPKSNNDQLMWSPLSSPVKSSTVDLSSLSPPGHRPDPAWMYVAKLLSRNKQEGAEEEDFVKQMTQSPQIQGLRQIRQVLRDCTSHTSRMRFILDKQSPDKTS